jgi:hypothetical protein
MTWLVRRALLGPKKSVGRVPPNLVYAELVLIPSIVRLSVTRAPRPHDDHERKKITRNLPAPVIMTGAFSIVMTLGLDF